MYILSGRGIAEIDNAEVEVGPGNFLGFTALSVAPYLPNLFEADLVYLMGGERCPVEVGEFLRHQKRVIRDGNEACFVDLNSIEAFSFEGLRTADSKGREMLSAISDVYPI